MPPKKKSKKSIPAKTKISQLLTHDEVPASVGLVNAVRAELVAQIRTVDKKVDCLDKKVDRLDKRVDALDKKVNALDKKVDALDKKVDALECKMDIGFEQLIANSHRTQVLMEEQRSENRIVLDGIKSVMERQDRMEVQAEEFRRTLQTLISRKEDFT
jgi:uncharacterized protein YhaN